MLIVIQIKKRRLRDEAYTTITLLYQSRLCSANKIKTVYSVIFAAFGLDIDNFNKELSSHLKSGHDPAPGVLIDAARNLLIENIDRGFEEYVFPLIHNENHEAIFRAIKDILRVTFKSPGA